MSDPHTEQLETFRAFIKAAEGGAMIPPVDERDLKALHELCVERAKRYCGKDGVISIELTSRACSVDANVAAVWLRHTQLRALVRQGYLAEWQHGFELDKAVFHVAATIAMRGVRLEHEEFLRQLRADKARVPMPRR